MLISTVVCEPPCRGHLRFRLGHGHLRIAVILKENMNWRFAIRMSPTAEDLLTTFVSQRNLRLDTGQTGSFGAGVFLRISGTL